MNELDSGTEVRKTDAHPQNANIFRVSHAVLGELLQLDPGHDPAVPKKTQLQNVAAIADWVGDLKYDKKLKAGSINVYVDSDKVIENGFCYPCLDWRWHTDICRHHPSKRS